MEQGTSRCKWCHAPIKWARTVAGAKIPLDMNPHPDGNLELVNGIAYYQGKSTNPADVRHMPHHATCTSLIANKEKH